MTTEETKATLTRDEVRPFGGCCGQYTIDDHSVSACAGCPVMTAVLNERIARHASEKELSQAKAALESSLASKEELLHRAMTALGKLDALIGFAETVRTADFGDWIEEYHPQVDEAYSLCADVLKDYESITDRKASDGDYCTRGEGSNP